MTLECSECGNDLRLGHATGCVNDRQCQAIVEDKGYPTNPHLCSRQACKGSRYCTQHRKLRESGESA